MVKKVICKVVSYMKCIPVEVGATSYTIVSEVLSGFLVAKVL